MRTHTFIGVFAWLTGLALMAALTATQAIGQCQIDDHNLLADTRSGGVTDVLPGLNGEIYLLIESGPDTLSNGAFSGTPGHLLFKYNAAFELLWWRQIQSTGSIAMNLDSNGRVLISGASIIGTDTLTPHGLPYITRLDGNGMIEKLIPIRDARRLEARGSRLAVSRDAIYYIGRRLDTFGVTLVKMDYQGDTIWTRHGETNGYYLTGISEIHDIAVDPGGNVYVAGEYQRELVFGTDTLWSDSVRTGWNEYAFFIVSWNTDGAYQWSVNRLRRGGSDLTYWSNQYFAISDDNLYMVAYDPTEARFIQGRDTVPVGPFFIANFHFDGRLKWVRTYDFKKPPTQDVFEVEAGTSGSVIVSIPGTPRREISRYSDRDSLVVDPRGHMILRHDSEGNVICAKNFPNAAFSRIGADRNGTVFMGGMFGEYTVFNGTDTVRSTVLPRRTMYLARFGSETVRAPLEPGRTASLDVYPNPASGTVTVALPEGASGTVELRLSDLLGSIVYTSHGPADQATMQIPVGALPSGTYLLWLTVGGKVYQERVLIAR